MARHKPQALAAGQLINSSAAEISPGRSRCMGAVITNNIALCVEQPASQQASRRQTSDNRSWARLVSFVTRNVCSTCEGQVEQNQIDSLLPGYATSPESRPVGQLTRQVRGRPQSGQVRALPTYLSCVFRADPHNKGAAASCRCRQFIPGKLACLQTNTPNSRLVSALASWPARQQQFGQSARRTDRPIDRSRRR